MQEIPPVSQTRAPAIERVKSNVETKTGQPATTPRSNDSVELSTAARLLSKLAELPDVRQDLVDRVRAEIQAGTYETDEKINAAIDDLIQDL